VEARPWNLLERDKPDLLFLDIQMPEVDGFDLLDALEGSIPAVIFVTAYDNTRSVLSMRKLSTTC